MTDIRKVWIMTVPVIIKPGQPGILHFEDLGDN